MKRNKDKPQVQNRQPLDVAQLETSLLNIKTLMATTGLSRSTIYAKVRAGALPAPIKIGGCIRWSSSSVRQWIESLATSAK